MARVVDLMSSDDEIEPVQQVARLPPPAVRAATAIDLLSDDERTPRNQWRVRRSYKRTHILDMFEIDDDEEEDRKMPATTGFTRNRDTADLPECDSLSISSIEEDGKMPAVDNSNTRKRHRVSSDSDDCLLLDQSDDDIQIVGEKKAPPPPCPLQQVLEIFPDADEKQVETLLNQHGGQVQYVVNHMTEKGYNKVGVKKKPPPPDSIVLHKADGNGTRKWTYDFLSAGSFKPSEAYKKEATRQLQQDFKFLFEKGAKLYLVAAKGHYAIAHGAIIDALLQRTKGKKYADEDDEYNDFRAMKKVFNGSKLDNAQVASLQTVGTPKARLVKKRRYNQEELVAITDPVLREELDFVQFKWKEWASKMSQYRKRKEARAEAEKNNSAVECQCCFANYAPQEIVFCKEKGHPFCVDCLHGFAKSQIFGSGNLGVDPTTKKRATELKCMHVDGCSSGFDLRSLQKALPQQVLDKYNELQFQAVLGEAGIDDLVECPKCGFKAELPESEMIFRCPVAECQHESCRKCGEDPHIPLRCEEVEKKHETKGRLRVEEAISRAKIRTCPRKGCGKSFIKDSGCNKMTCACGAFLCYICREDITQEGYNHFCQKPHCDHKSCGKCVLHTNSEQDDAQAMREAGVQEAEAVRAETSATKDGGDGEVNVNVEALIGPQVATAPTAAGVRLAPPGQPPRLPQQRVVRQPRQERAGRLRNEDVAELRAMFAHAQGRRGQGQAQAQMRALARRLR